MLSLKFNLELLALTEGGVFGLFLYKINTINPGENITAYQNND